MLTLHVATGHAPRWRRAGGYRGLRALALGVALMALLPAGCAAPQVETGEVPRPDADTGLVVLSLTRSGQRGFDLLFQLEGPGVGLNSVVRLNAHAPSLDWGGAPGDGPTPEAQPEGRLYVLRLAPGTHRIRYWWGESRLRGFNGVGFKIYSDPVAVEFTSRAGEVVYAGNVHLALPLKINYLASQTPSTYRLETTDRRERDFPVLRERFPGLAPETVRVAQAQNRDGDRPLPYYVINFSDSGGGPLLLQ